MRENNKNLIVKLKPEKSFKKQIVQSEDTDNREIKDGHFLSDKNRFFEKEARSKVTDVFRNGGTQNAEKMKSHIPLKFSDLGSLVNRDPFKKAAKNYSKQKKENVGVSSTNDYIEDIPLGDVTHLNTMEYKYYGFYHRIRQKLEQFWGRFLHEKTEQLARRGRRISHSQEHMTSLQITLDHKGHIISLKVIGSSGVKELDDAAVDSFNQAGPFPNPPKDLLVNGRVTLEWGFVVKS